MARWKTFYKKKKFKKFKKRLGKKISERNKRFDKNWKRFRGETDIPGDSTGRAAS